jgi:hypothetical protein
MKAMVVVASLSLAACSGKDSSPPTDSSPDRGPAEIELSVDELLYEATAVDRTATKSITVRNIGGTELDVESVQVAPPFETTFNLMTLEPGGAGIINVVFAPTTHGHFEEGLSVLSTDPNHPSVSVTCASATISRTPTGRLRRRLRPRPGLRRHEPQHQSRSRRDLVQRRQRQLHLREHAVQ